MNELKFIFAAFFFVPVRRSTVTHVVFVFRVGVAIARSLSELHKPDARPTSFQLIGAQKIIKPTTIRINANDVDRDMFNVTVTPDCEKLVRVQCRVPCITTNDGTQTLNASRTSVFE